MRSHLRAIAQRFEQAPERCLGRVRFRAPAERCCGHALVQICCHCSAGLAKQLAHCLRRRQRLWLARWRAVVAGNAHSLRPCRLASDFPNREPARAKRFLPDRSVCERASRTLRQLHLLPNRALHTARCEPRLLGHRQFLQQAPLLRALQPVKRRARRAFVWSLRQRLWFLVVIRVQQSRHQQQCLREHPRRLRLPRARVNRLRPSKPPEFDRQKPRRGASMIRAPHDEHRQSPGSILGAAA